VNEREWKPRPHFPYSHLNLCRNPFGEATTQERISLAIADTDEMRRTFRQPKTAIQLVGRHGRGKTSHLLALKRELLAHDGLDAAYIRLRDQFWIPPSKHILLDEGEFLFRRSFWRLRLVTSLAISTHRDWSRALRALGFSVKTIQIATVCPTRLKQVFEKRMEWSRRNPGPLPLISEQTTGRLIERFGDDIRAMEAALYDGIQAMGELGHVEV
jgi:hypothetical protein